MTLFCFLFDNKETEIWLKHRIWQDMRTECDKEKTDKQDVMFLHLSSGMMSAQQWENVKCWPQQYGECWSVPFKQSCRHLGLKISLASVRKVYRQKLLRYKTTHSSQSVSQSASTVLWTREQSETSCRLLAPLGAFVTTTLILIVRTFIRVELPRSSSDKTDIVSSMRDIINNKYFIRFLAASKMLLNVDWSVPLDHCNYPAQYYTEIIIWLIT